jgi:hypothetical protein
LSQWKLLFIQSWFNRKGPWYIFMKFTLSFYTLYPNILEQKKGLPFDVIRNKLDIYQIISDHMDMWWMNGMRWDTPNKHINMEHCRCRSKHGQVAFVSWLIWNILNISIFERAYGNEALECHGTILQLYVYFLQIFGM